MKLRLSRKAYEDFLAIHAEGVARFGFRQAEIYADDLERVFALIAASPGLARLRAELDPPVRIHPHRAHLIVYETRGDSMLILRIRHAAEDWANDPL